MPRKTYLFTRQEFSNLRDELASVKLHLDKEEVSTQDAQNALDHLLAAELQLNSVARECE